MQWLAGRQGDSPCNGFRISYSQSYSRLSSAEEDNAVTQVRTQLSRTELAAMRGRDKKGGHVGLVWVCECEAQSGTGDNLQARFRALIRMQ